MSALPMEPLSVPLREVEGGSVRIGQSSVLLDVVIRAFDNGASPEAIVESYDTLRLADVYAVLAYYLYNQESVKSYLQQRREQGEELRCKIEARQPDRAQLHAKLLARRAQLEQTHAASTQ